MKIKKCILSIEIVKIQDKNDKDMKTLIQFNRFCMYRLKFKFQEFVFALTIYNKIIRKIGAEKSSF